jgi:WD40 repeat protein
VRRKRRLVAGTAGACLLIVLLVVLLVRLLPGAGGDTNNDRAATPQQSSDEAEMAHQAEADEALKALAAKAGDAETTFVDFTKDVATFQVKYVGTPAAIRAPELLMKLRSSLDALDPKKLPQDCLDYWRASGHEPPSELVGVLGEHRRRHWRPAIAIGLAVHPGTNLVATSSAGAGDHIYLWDLASDTLRKIVRNSGGAGTALAFSPDGTVLASGSGDYAIRLWDIGKAPVTELQVMKAHKSDIKTLAFSPKGDRLASASFDGTLRLWSFTAGRLTEEECLRGDRSFFDVAWSPDGKLLAGSDASTVRLWDVSSVPVRVVASLKDNGSAVVGLALSPDGKLLATGAYDNTIRLWSLGTGQPVENLVLRGNSERAEVLTFSADGKHLASQAWDGTLRLWDYQTGQGEILFLGPGGTIGNIRFIPKSNKFVSSHADGTVRLWDAAAGKEVLPLVGQVGPANGVAFAPDCRALVSAGNDKSVRLWDAITGKEMRSAQGSAALHSVAFLPDGRHVVVRSDEAIATWDVASAKWDTTIECGTYSNAAVSPDGRRIVAGTLDGAVLSWEADTGKLIDSRKGHLPLVRAVAISQDGKTLAVGSGNHEQQTGEVRLWDIGSGRKQNQWSIARPVFSLAFSPDGTILAVGSAVGPQQNPAVQLFDVRTGAEPIRLPNTVQVHGVHGLAYAPDGRTLVSLGNWQQQFSLIVWDTSSGTALRELALPGPASAVAFAADGRHVATANGNGTIYIFRVETAALKR